MPSSSRGCAATRAAVDERLHATAPELAASWLLVEHPGPWPSEGCPARRRLRALGAEDEAAEELAEYEQRAKAVGDAINAKAGSPTISIVRFLDGPTRLMQKKSFIGAILADAGLACPASRDVDDFAAEISDVADEIWMTSASVQGAHLVLDDLATTFGVDAAKS